VGSWGSRSGGEDARFTNVDASRIRTEKQLGIKTDPSEDLDVLGNIRAQGDRLKFTRYLLRDVSTTFGLASRTIADDSYGPVTGSSLIGTSSILTNLLKGYASEHLNVDLAGATKETRFRDNTGKIMHSIAAGGVQTSREPTVGGGPQLKPYAATVDLSASSTIETNVPTGSVIVGVTFKVTTVIVISGGTTWDATLSGGASDVVASGVAVAVNTKANFDTTGIKVTSETDIAITPDAGSFTSGIIAAVVWARKMIDMD